LKDNIVAPNDFWPMTPCANLVRYVPAGFYFSRIRVRGKLIRLSLCRTSCSSPSLGGFILKNRVSAATREKNPTLIARRVKT
jgi:hypothetical protein